MKRRRKRMRCCNFYEISRSGCCNRSDETRWRGPIGDCCSRNRRFNSFANDYDY